MSSATTPRFTKALLLVSAAIFLALPLIHTNITTTGESISSSQDRQQRNSSAFAVMLGEFRTSISDTLFVKTERYMHSGIAYAPHLNERQMAATGQVTTTESPLDNQLATPEMRESAQIAPGSVTTHDHDHEHNDHGHHDHDEHEHHDHDDHHHHHHDHDHDDPDHICTAHCGHEHDHECTACCGGVETLIRTPEADFRGFIGHLERQVKPWRDPSEPHYHTAGTELLPWYRLATLSNPQNVRNYMIGAWWLKSLNTPEQLEEAEAFLREGIEKNPDSYELPLMLGYTLRESDRNQEALQFFRKSAELGIKRRPPGGAAAGQTWDDTDDEQLSAAIRMDVFLTRDLESTSTAVSRVQQYITALPDEPSIPPMLTSLTSEN